MLCRPAARLLPSIPRRYRFHIRSTGFAQAARRVHDR